MNLQTVEIANLITFKEAMIQFDNAELIQKAIEETVKYKNLVVTEEGLQSVKKDIANLNKLIKNLEDQRKLVKKTYNEPLDQFETKIKEVVAILERANKQLKDQTDNFEQKRINEKRNAIETIFEKKLCDTWLWTKYHAEFKIIPDNWLNATTTIKSVTEAIDINYKRLCALQHQEIQAKELQVENERLKKEAQEAEFKSLVSLLDIYNSANNTTFTIHDIKPFTKENLIKYFEKVKEKLAQQQSVEILQPISSTGTITASTIKAKGLDITVTEISKQEGVVQHKLLPNSLLIKNLTEQERKSVMASLIKKLPHVIIEEMEV